MMLVTKDNYHCKNNQWQTWYAHGDLKGLVYIPYTITCWMFMPHILSFRRHVIIIEFMSSSCETALRRMPQNSFEWSTLVQVMAWCRQATSHYLRQRWARARSPYAVTRTQWVESPFPLTQEFHMPSKDYLPDNQPTDSDKVADKIADIFCEL